MLKAAKLKEEIKSDSSPQPSEKSDEEDDENNKVSIFHTIKISIQFFLLVSICIDTSSARLNKIKTPQCHLFPVATAIDVASGQAHTVFWLYLFQFNNKLINEELAVFQIMEYVMELWNNLCYKNVMV